MTNIRIAIENVAAELAFESTQSNKEIHEAVDAALAKGSTLHLVDAKGREYLIPSGKIGFVEIGPQAERRVGFAK